MKIQMVDTPSDAPPRWTVSRAAVTTADILLGCCLVLAASIQTFSGVRLRFGGTRLEASSVWPAAVAAVLLLIIRHAIQRSPNAAEVGARTLLRICRSPDWKAAVLVGVTSRVTIWSVAFLALTFSADSPGVRLRSTSGSPIQMEDVFVKWDGGWYIFTAAHGYLWEGHTDRLQNVAFFPAYPMLIRTVGSLMGARVVNTDPREGTSRDFQVAQERRLIFAGLLISCIAFVWALQNLKQIATLIADASTGPVAVLLLAWYPFAVFYGGVYTESLFLVALTGAWLEILRDRWGVSAAWGLLLGLSRPVGFLVSIPLAMLAFRRLSRPPARLLPFLAVCAPLAGVLAFSWYMSGYTGHWFEWVEAQRAWNRFNPDVNPIRMIPDRIHAISTDGIWNYIYHRPEELLNAVATMGALGLVIPIGRRFGAEYGVLTVLLVGLPFFAGGFMTMGRFTAPVFPVFIYLASVHRSSVRDVVVPVWAALQGLVATLHVLGKPLY